MSKTLHLPGGDKQIPTTEEEQAAQQLREQQEQQMRSWVEQAEPYEISLIQWDQIESDEMAQTVMNGVQEFVAAFTMARIMHHSAATGAPPKSVGVTLQIRTFNDADEVLEDVQVDLNKLANK